MHHFHLKNKENSGEGHTSPANLAPPMKFSGYSLACASTVQSALRPRRTVHFCYSANLRFTLSPSRPPPDQKISPVLHELHKLCLGVRGKAVSPFAPYWLRHWEPISMKQIKNSRKSEDQNLCPKWQNVQHSREHMHSNDYTTAKSLPR